MMDSVGLFGSLPYERQILIHSYVLVIWQINYLSVSSPMKYGVVVVTQTWLTMTAYSMTADWDLRF
jgi:hypothetical protein